MDIKHSWHFNVNKPALEICSYDQELIFTEETGDQVRIDGLERKALLSAISTYVARLAIVGRDIEQTDIHWLLLVKSNIEDTLTTWEEAQRNDI